MKIFTKRLKTFEWISKSNSYFHTWKDKTQRSMWTVSRLLRPLQGSRCQYLYLSNCNMWRNPTRASCQGASESLKAVPRLLWSAGQEQIKGFFWGSFPTRDKEPGITRPDSAPGHKYHWYAAEMQSPTWVTLQHVLKPQTHVIDQCGWSTIHCTNSVHTVEQYGWLHSVCSRQWPKRPTRKSRKETKRRSCFIARTGKGKWPRSSL